MAEVEQEITGLVFNIQRFSVHDGPGIRTVVFLKGCGLRCLWCSNPESQSLHPELAINWNTCTGCKTCVDYCPHGANRIIEGKLFYFKELCQLCEGCIHSCPAGSRKLYGRSMSLREVLEEVKKDRPFYDNSSGGITVSGGEPFLQPQVLRYLLAESQRELIHTAVETCGCFRWERITDEILDSVELMLFDLKLMDGGRHRTLTGQENLIILKNLEKMTNRVRTIIRIPIIPGFNDDMENIDAMVRFILDLKKIDEVNIIPYHAYGEFKYAMLQREYPKEKFSAPSSERLAEIRDAFESKGIRTMIEN